MINNKNIYQLKIENSKELYWSVIKKIKHCKLKKLFSLHR